MNKITGMEFVGLVNDDIIIKDPMTNSTHTFAYHGRVLTAKDDTVLSFDVGETTYFVLQHVSKTPHIEYAILSEEDCRKILLNNIDNILHGNAFEL